MFVHNFHNSRAPNPVCCSDPRVLCAKCAAAALADERLTVNEDDDDMDMVQYFTPTLPTENASDAPFDPWLEALERIG